MNEKHHLAYFISTIVPRTFGSRCGCRVVFDAGEERLFPCAAEETRKMSKNVRTRLPSSWMFFPLSNRQPLQISPHVLFFFQAAGHELSLLCPCLKCSPASLYPSALWVSSRCPGAMHQIEYGSDLNVQTSGFNICHTTACRRQTVIPGCFIVDLMRQTCGSDPVHTCPLHPHFLLECMTTWHIEGGGKRGGGCCLIPLTMKGGVSGFVYSALILRKEQGGWGWGVNHVITRNLDYGGSWLVSTCERIFSFRATKLASGLWAHFLFLRASR